jgi:hypothetical protein
MHKKATDLQFADPRHPIFGEASSGAKCDGVARGPDILSANVLQH